MAAERVKVGTKLIEIDGKMKDFLRFLGFETYVPPEKTNEHIEEVLTEKEIKALERKEMKYQEKQKKRRKKKEKEMANRKRAKKKKISKKKSVCLLVNQL